MSAKSFVVIGLGRFGSMVATELCRAGNEVLGIDENEDRVNLAADLLTHAVACDVMNEAALRSLGVRNFDCAVVALEDNANSNVLITLMLKEMGVGMVVAKAQDMLNMKVLQKVGADRVVFPERDMGQRLAQSLTSSSIIDYIELTDDYSIVELGLPKSWEGKTIREVNARSAYGINIIAVRNGQDIALSPSAGYKFKRGDLLVALGANDDVAEFKVL
jgi:trk system potassium uptake protein TrkA